MSNYMMIDIETMGVDFKNDDIIQIGILECTKDLAGYYHPGRSYLRTLFTDQKPKDEWIAKNHAELLPVCYNTDYASAPEIRADILNFFHSCGVDKRVPLMGLNAAIFDIPYMMEKRYLKSDDYHYRIYELRGAIALTKDVMGIDDDKELFRKLEESGPKLFELPKGKKHEALYDCYKQLQNLNGMIQMLRMR